MLSDEALRASSVSVARLDAYEAAAIVVAEKAVSIVGHADVAAIMGNALGIAVEYNRVTASVGIGDRLIVGQYRGPRLPEGCKSLPKGSNITWVLVTISNS